MRPIVTGYFCYLLLLIQEDQQAEGLPWTSNKSVLLRDWRGTINLASQLNEGCLKFQLNYFSSTHFTDEEFINKRIK